MAQAQSTLIRRFQGVNRQIESVFLGPTLLQSATNWIPDTTYLLTKRPGTVSFGSAISGTTGVSGMLRVLQSSTRYLYLYRQTAIVDDLYVYTNDGLTAAAVPNGLFPSSGRVGRMIAYGDAVYVGNGVDPLKRVPFGGTAVALTAITAFADGSAAATLSADTGAAILTGDYAYAWAIYDHTNDVWMERSNARTVSVGVSGDIRFDFPLPTGFTTNGGALSSRYRAHLFIAPVGYPVEFGHDHTPSGITTSPPSIRQILADGLPLPLIGTNRTGNVFAVHRGRIWLAGDANNPSRVYATHTLLPGYEQTIFNQGLFFPANALLNFPEPVTALAVASVSQNNDPQSPMAIFTTTRTFFWFGDILDDPSAYRVEVSSRVGCLGPDAVVATPVGLIFVGLESVYRIPPGGGVPEDLGWPIAPAIKAIPYGMRGRTLAFYHKGFVKVCFTAPGGSTNTVEYWLDLRAGLTTPPSWWGPHTGVAPSAVATSLLETSEFDRAWAAPASSDGSLQLLHQTDVYTEQGSPIVSVLDTGAVDHGAPFVAKLYTLLRCIGRAQQATRVAVVLTTDGGQTWGMDRSLEFAGGAGAVWNVDNWGEGQWSTTLFEEVQAEAPATRPRGLSVAIGLTHSEAIRLDLRDFDLMTAPIERPKRANRLGGTPPAGA